VTRTRRPVVTAGPSTYLTESFTSIQRLVACSVMAMDPCSLCGPSLTPVIHEGAHWQVRLNLNQNLLGKLIVVLKRHEEEVVHLSTDEWTELHAQISLMTALLRAAFEPDHFNYAFLQNQDRHVHLHIIPRYARPRDLAGLRFDDPDYPGHYAVPAPDRRVSFAVLNAIARELRSVTALP
jgi:diadenosine tetraphosphate (Ap4A) HIT family hydrolase